VYIWGDGEPCTIRLEDERLCTLVVLGARADGPRAVMAVEDGDRESTERWRSVWRGLKRRGMGAPVVALGAGALGFWNAVGEVWHETREPRGWGHRLARMQMDAHGVQLLHGQGSGIVHPVGLHLLTDGAGDEELQRWEMTSGELFPRLLDHLDGLRNTGDIRGQSHLREGRTDATGRGVPGNRHPYRDCLERLGGEIG
jgi:hypothetical protein